MLNLYFMGDSSKDENITRRPYIQITSELTRPVSVKETAATTTVQTLFENPQRRQFVWQ